MSEEMGDAEREWLDEQARELRPDGAPLSDDVQYLLGVVAQAMFRPEPLEWEEINGWFVLEIRRGGYKAHVRYLKKNGHASNPAGYHWSVTQYGNTVAFGYGVKDPREAQMLAEQAILENRELTSRKRG